MQEIWLQSLGREDSLEKDIATHSSILAWRIPTYRAALWAPVHGVAKRDTFNFQSLSSLFLNISFPTHQAYAAFVYLLNTSKEEFELCPFTIWMFAELLCVSLARSILVNLIFGPQIWMSIIPPFLLVTISQCVCYFHQTGLFTLPWILPIFSPILSHLILFPPTLVMPAT